MPCIFFINQNPCRILGSVSINRENERENERQTDRQRKKETEILQTEIDKDIEC